MEEVPELENVPGGMAEVSDKPETFSKVRRKRKRSKVTDMDAEEGGLGGEDSVAAATAKRPAFPPVDASTIVVSTKSITCV